VIALDELAAGVAAVLDAEKIADCAVLGGSFGGAVAQVVVRRFPGRVRSLILSNTGVPMRNLVGAQWVALSIFKIAPWPGICTLLRSSLTKLLSPPAQDRRFWRAYFD
jgi:pimeloyl-ACP methyl ester carboxylesterase